MGRSRGGLISKVHAQRTARAARSYPGEAHNNRLCSVLLDGLRPQTIVLTTVGLTYISCLDIPLGLDGPPVEPGAYLLATVDLHVPMEPVRPTAVIEC